MCEYLYQSIVVDSPNQKFQPDVGIGQRISKNYQDTLPGALDLCSKLNDNPTGVFFIFQRQPKMSTSLWRWMKSQGRHAPATMNNWAISHGNPLLLRSGNRSHVLD